MNKYEKVIKVVQKIIRMNHHWNVPDLPKVYQKVMKELEKEMEIVNEKV